MMRKSGVLFMVCTLAVCTSCAVLRPAPRAPVEPVVSELEYESVEGIQSRFGYIGQRIVPLSDSPTEALVAEPVYSSERPLYAVIELGDPKEAFTLVIDESDGTGSGYDILIMDANNNQDLTDDPKAAVASQPGESTPVEIRLASKGRDYPHHLSIYPCGSPDHAHIYSTGYCKGKLTFGDKTYKVALFDDNCNGTFSDAYAVPSESPRGGMVYAMGDTMVIDIDGDGKFRKQLNDTPEMYHVGKYVSFGGRCYELDIEASGRKATVRETEAPCGYITSKQTGYSVELLGGDGALKLNGRAPRVKVPAGEYRLAACSFEGEGDEGKLWRIVGRGVWGQQAIEVDRGRKLLLTFGPPLTASITAVRNGDAFDFRLEIKGQGGEIYSAGDFQRAGSMLPPPRFEIRDEKGETVVRGQFEYG